MERTEHHDRSNCGASKLDTYTAADTREPDDLYVDHLPGCTGLFKFLTAVVPQAEIQTLTRHRLLYYLGMAFDLVADRCANKIRTVGVETFLNHQIDVAKIHTAQVDRNFLGVT